MARPKKADTVTLVKIVDRFYEEEARGDPRKIKATKLAAFAVSLGYDIKEYDFRRCAAVRQRIQEMKESCKGINGDITSIAYKTLDVEGIIKGCSSVEELRQALLEMDRYWKEIYSTAVEKSRECVKLQSERDGFLEKIQDLQKSGKVLENDISLQQTEMNKLRKENTYLRSMIRKYLYPGIVKELLKEEHVSTEENTSVIPEMMPQLIEGVRPAAFTGIQRDVKKTPSRSERLIEQLKRQAGHE